MEERSSTSLLSSSKSSDSQLQVQLHPLVILTISDYVTRHVLRQQSGPIVGAILGAQSGREITLETAFECKIDVKDDGETILDGGWFHDRLQQFRDVHKGPPQLDLVGWFTIAPPSGPQPQHLAVHKQLLQDYNESSVLVAFDPSSVAESTSSGGKLPITVYESVYEASSGSGDADKPMSSTGEGPQLVLRFKELPYTVETGEAEMIGVDFVARGGANASSSNGTTDQSENSSAAKGKGKGKTTRGDSKPQANGTCHESDTGTLSPEEEELIASLTAKANAVKMLRQRIGLLKKYLASLPPCYLNTASASTTPDRPTTTPMSPDARISHPILRSIAALLARLPLLAPTDIPPTKGPATATTATTTTTSTADPANTSTLAQEAARERSDVALVSLLGALGSTLREAQELGRKADVVGTAVSARQRGGGGLGSGMASMLRDRDRDGLGSEWMMA